jgi:hypothetical protein
VESISLHKLRTWRQTPESELGVWDDLRDKGMHDAHGQWTTCNMADSIRDSPPTLIHIFPFPGSPVEANQKPPHRTSGSLVP